MLGQLILYLGSSHHLWQHLIQAVTLQDGLCSGVNYALRMFALLYSRWYILERGSSAQSLSAEL